MPVEISVLPPPNGLLQNELLNIFTGIITTIARMTAIIIRIMDHRRKKSGMGDGAKLRGQAV
jgi:hypothetical protein